MKRKTFLLLSVLLCSIGLQATAFPSRTDFRDESIYFVMTTRFYNGDPSNDTQCWDAQQYNVGDPAWRGDFKGVIERLDYIKALGFTAIWVTPIVENASGYDYHGYHASNFSEVDRRYETHTETEDVLFQNLIDAAHARGMKVILDIVLNHTGNFGEENLCKLFTRDWNADQSQINECMIPYTQKDGGKLPNDYLSLKAGLQHAARLAQMKNTDGNNNDKNNYWHHFGSFDWDDDTRWWAQIAGDCVDLNTENQYVANYLVRCYGEFIKMGVDGFRIDTGGFISRLTFNNNFIPQFEALAEQYKEKRNGGDFFMFGYVCARYRNVTYRGKDNMSPYFYTWKETKDYAWDTSETSWNSIVVPDGSKGTHTNVTSVDQQGEDYSGEHSDNRTSTNALLNGNTYHTPDYSQASGLSVVDYPMHYNFRTANEAWSVKGGDKYYNDATWNVVYVDSHEYAPEGAPENQRFNQPQDTWAENLSLMFTFRGIPCIYYGSEIEFKKGCVIDKGPNIALRETGRAYYGGYIKGTIKATDFGEYTATGNVAQTLSHPLAKHIIRLNRIRQAVPALRKGQYSTEGCTGSFAFKRRYTDDTTDSYALVCISDSATFAGVLNGTYVDCVTGDTAIVTNDTLTATCSGKGNMRVYVLTTTLTPAPGKIGSDGYYLFGTTRGSITNPVWDGTEEALEEEESSEEPEEAVAPCIDSNDQLCVFFNSEGNSIFSNVYAYFYGGEATPVSLPGVPATSLGNNMWKVVVPESVRTPAFVIWNNGSGTQTSEFTYQNHAIYNNTSVTSTIVTLLCGNVPTDMQNTKVATAVAKKYWWSGQLVIEREGIRYDILGNTID